MAKQINYLLIAFGVTGDSNVLFYATPELAEQAFKNLTQPLVDVCMNNYYDTDKHDVFETFQDDKAIRFNSGIIDALDILIGESNVYYEWGTKTVDDNVSHYIAEFSEWVDDSSITFHNQQDAEIKYNKAINDGIQTANDHHHHNVSRDNPETWEGEDFETLFSETITTYSDAYFGYNVDCSYTYRYGSISN
jgi:hypothetical protein